MPLSEWPEKFKQPDPVETDYIIVEFSKEMVFLENLSTEHAICIRERGHPHPRNQEWISVKHLRHINGKPQLPATTYFRELELEETYAYNRFPQLLP